MQKVQSCVGSQKDPSLNITDQHLSYAKDALQKEMMMGAVRTEDEEESCCRHHDVVDL